MHRCSKLARPTCDGSPTCPASAIPKASGTWHVEGSIGFETLEELNRCSCSACWLAKPLQGARRDLSSLNRMGVSELATAMIQWRIETDCMIAKLTARIFMLQDRPVPLSERDEHAPRRLAVCKLTPHKPVLELSRAASRFAKSASVGCLVSLASIYCVHAWLS